MEAKKRIKIGDKAIHFSAPDVNGELVHSKDYTDKYLLIAFLRYAGCPWCNLAIHRLVYEQDLLENNGCSVFAFIPSSKENIIAHIHNRHKREPEFPVFADQEMKIFAKYAVKPSLGSSLKMITKIPYWVHAVKNEGFGQKNIDGSLFLAPALFLVSSLTNTFIRTDYNANLFDHEAFTVIYRAINESNREN
jgi:peroxiredoxin